MDVKTTRKKKFLHAEYKHFNFSNYKEFADIMQSDVVPCKSCGILYWDGCKKRCDCSLNIENTEQVTSDTADSHE